MSLASVSSVNRCCCDEAQAAGAKQLDTFTTAFPRRLQVSTNRLICYRDSQKHRHCVPTISLLIPIHPLAAIIPLNRMKATSICDMRPIRTLPISSEHEAKARPNLKTDRSARVMTVVKTRPTAVCACMQCSTWEREAQAPRLRVCTIRH